MGRYNSDVTMNFRIHRDLKKEFQIICDNYHVSMSGRINDFIREYVRDVRENSRSDLHIKKGKEQKWNRVIGDWRDDLIRGNGW